MFYNSSYGPAMILNILWKMSSRTPVSMISRLLCGTESSEIYKWISFFRDVAGSYEDKHLVIMGGPDCPVEADGTFVIGRRKNALGRMRSKEHVYVVTQRGARKTVVILRGKCR